MALFLLPPLPSFHSFPPSSFLPLLPLIPPILQPAAIFAMPAAPPPTQNPPFSGDEISTTPVTPPTSPQRYQQAARLEERLHHVMGSPDQRRTPAGPLTLPAPAPQAASAGPSMHPAPAPQAAPAPLTFNGQTYTYLPPHLAAMVAGVVAFLEPPRRRRRVPPQPFPLPPPPPPPAPIGSGPALGPG